LCHSLSYYLRLSHIIDNKRLPFGAGKYEYVCVKKSGIGSITNTATLQRAKNYLYKIICLQFMTYRQENSFELNP